MEEVQRYADLLSFIEASESDHSSNWSEPVSASSEHDPEIREWSLILSKASPGLMHKAKLRICTAGLKAVHRHISSHPHSD